MPAALRSQALLNAVYTRPTMRRRYEVWFIRLHLADGSGAWWFRYLYGCAGAGAGGICSAFQRMAEVMRTRPLGWS